MSRLDPDFPPPEAETRYGSSGPLPGLAFGESPDAYGEGVNFGEMYPTLSTEERTPPESLFVGYDDADLNLFAIGFVAGLLRGNTEAHLDALERIAEDPTGTTMMRLREVGFGDDDLAEFADSLVFEPSSPLRSRAMRVMEKITGDQWSKVAVQLPIREHGPRGG